MLVQTHVCLVVVNVCFGVTVIVGRLGVQSFDPVVFTIWRFFLAAPLLAVLQVYRDGMPLPSLLDVPLLLQASVCLVTSNFAMTVGISLSGPIITSMWQPMTLVFTALFSMLVCRTEELTLRKLLGIFSGLAGAGGLFLGDPAVASTLRHGFHGPTGNMWGHVALFLGCLSSGYLNVLRRQMHKRKVCNGVQLRSATWTQVFSVPLLLTFSLVAGSSDQVRALVCSGCSSLLSPPHQPGVWACLLFYAIVPSAFCQSALAWAAQRAEPSTLAMYTTLQPAISAILTEVLRVAVPQLQSILAPPGTNLLGGVPITVGLWLVSSKGGAGTGQHCKSSGILAILLRLLHLRSSERAMSFGEEPLIGPSERISKVMPLLNEAEHNRTATSAQVCVSSQRLCIV